MKSIVIAGSSSGIGKATPKYFAEQGWKVAATMRKPENETELNQTDGMLIAIGLWWIYFDFVFHRKPQPIMSKVSQWFYLHLPMTAGIAAVGAAVFTIVEHSGEPLEVAVRWLLVASVALVLVGVALLMQAIKLPQEQYQLYRRGGIVTVASALLILLLGFISVPTLPFLLILVLLMLLPIFYGIKVWIQVFGAEGKEKTQSSLSFNVTSRNAELATCIYIYIHESIA